MKNNLFRKKLWTAMFSCCALVTVLTGCGTGSKPDSNLTNFPSESEDISMNENENTTTVSVETENTDAEETVQTTITAPETENVSTIEYTHRVILVSDMHYTTEETPKELKAVSPDYNTSDAAGDAFGYTQRGKIDCIVNDVNAFMENATVDAVLVLGDLSIDDYGFRTLPANYIQKFKEDCMDQLSCPSYAIPGNHDSYPNELWREVFSYDRQYSIKIGDAVFIMLDTFEAAPASGASGSDYCGIDADFLEQELEKYPTEQIFLCTHYVNHTKYDYRLNRILKDNDRIVCLFHGHTHKNDVLLPDGLAKRFLINIGGYGYQGEKIDNKWVFNQFDKAWAWGYTVLEWNETKAHVYHVKPARHYVGGNGEFDFTETIENELTITFNR